MRTGASAPVLVSGPLKNSWVILSVKPWNPASIFWTLAVRNLHCFWLVARSGGSGGAGMFCSLLLLSVLTLLKLAEHFLMLGELGRHWRVVRTIQEQV